MLGHTFLLTSFSCSAKVFKHIIAMYNFLRKNRLAEFVWFAEQVAARSAINFHSLVYWGTKRILFKGS